MKIRNRCPSCLGKSISLIYEEPFGSAGVRGYLQRHYEGHASTAAVEGDSFVLVRCDDCGLAFQKFVPDDALLNEIYNAWVPGTMLERQERNYSLDEYRYLAEQVQFLIEHFECAPAELEVLDFGFGWGHWSRMAMGFGCNVWGTELSRERLKYGKAIGIHVVELDEMPQQKFHFINTEQVFEHLVEPRLVLERLVESLSPNGLVKISVPDATSALKQLQRTREFAALPPQQQMPIAPLEHINSFDHASLVRLGESLGLKLVRPSFVRLLNSASGLLRPKNLARVVARPVYRHIFPRSTFVYFARA
jgi:hypothetical protein